MNNKAVQITIVLLLFMGCRKPDFNSNEVFPPDPCDVKFLKVIDPDCLDLEKFLIRKDSTFQYGFTTAIKAVPSKGAIEWNGNNYIMLNSQSKQYNLVIYNFADTINWTHLEFLAWVRDKIVLRIDPFNTGKQILEQKQDLSNYGGYGRSLDGGDVLGAYWQLNPAYENYLEITYISPKTGVVEGNFDVHFKISSSFGNPFSPLVHFRCGKFKAKIFKPDDLWKK